MSAVGAHAQWKANARGALSLAGAVLLVDGDDVLASTDAGETPDAYATELDEDGWVLADTDADGGLRLRVTPTQIIAH